VRRHPYFLVGWLWYLGTLVPVLGLVQVGLQSMACRYTYIPLIGLFIMVAFGYNCLSGLQKFRIVGVLVPVLVVVGCSMAAWWQLHPWKSSIALFRHALAVTTNNYAAHTNLGLALVEKGQLEEAITHFHVALRINPNFEHARIKLVFLLLERGRDDEAIENYSKISGRYPDFDKVQFNLGNLFLRRGDIDRAMWHYTKVLEANPDFAEAHNNLGLVLAMLNRPDQAIEHFKKAVQIRDDFSDAKNNLQRALEVKQSSVYPGAGNTGIK
jgi:tetratricopeptide (TPR) repeat protein